VLCFVGERKIMSPLKRIRVMVLYGGRSGEHEVSLRSAASVIRNLDRERFEIVPIAIDPQGQWTAQSLESLENAGPSLPIHKNAPSVFLPPYPCDTEHRLVYLNGSGKTQGIDVIFPVMHGTFCEDGTLQGLMEMAEVPYVGCGVLASAVGMDKDVAKRLVRDAGLPIVPYISLKQERWKSNRDAVSLQIAKELGYPVFVKPSNSGSSVGVHKVKEAHQLEDALKDAFLYDSKVLVEKAIQAREIEFAVIENSDPTQSPLVSIPGEIVPTHEFYSYEAKYLDDEGARLHIPAKIEASQISLAQKIAREAFEVLECEGMARVDFFLDKASGAFYFNEVNTLPGFTSISMYPKMWEASGISYRDLLSQLINLALARHQRRKTLVREYK
jgi:D-alanine-D-alanine ligase